MRKSSRGGSARRVNYARIKPRNRTGELLSCLLILAGLLLGMVLVGLYFVSEPEGELSLTAAPSPSAVSPTNTPSSNRVTALMLGIDRRTTEKCPCRSDTIMIVSMDPDTGTAGVITVPRDLWVPIPGVGEARINEALFHGELKKMPGGGPALAKQTVEYNLGIKINKYVLVDFFAFRRVVDTLGGIDIDVPTAIDDLTYPDEHYGYRPLHIPAGRNHMNGEMALAYARTRHTDNDFGRSRRQIQVLIAVREKALRLALLPRLPDLLKQFAGTIETDFALQEIIALAPAAMKIRTENIKTGSIDHTMTVDFRTPEGSNVLWLDRAKLGRLKDSIIPPASPRTLLDDEVQREAARIMIQNGTATPSLGLRTSNYLQLRGFQIVGVGNADRADYVKTVLVDYGRSKSATLRSLQGIFLLGPNNIHQLQDAKSDADIRLILGADWSIDP